MRKIVDLSMSAFLGKNSGILSNCVVFLSCVCLFYSILSSLLFALLLRGKINSQSMKDFISSRKSIAGTYLKPLEP